MPFGKRCDRLPANYRSATTTRFVLSLATRRTAWVGHVSTFPPLIRIQSNVRVDINGRLPTGQHRWTGSVHPEKTRFHWKTADKWG